MLSEIVQSLNGQMPLWAGLVVSGFFVVWLVLCIIALLRARPEDIPDVVQALAKWGRR
jgi:hypothetical protein